MQTSAWQPEHCAESLKALADPIRLRIIEQLRTGPRNVGDLAAALETTAVTISHHLGILYHAGLVRRAKRGRFVDYSLERKIIVRTTRGAEHIDLRCCRLELPRR